MNSVVVLLKLQFILTPYGVGLVYGAGVGLPCNENKRVHI
jgi:hypothetical protein